MSTTDYGQIGTTITRQDPDIEEFRKALLRDVEAQVKKDLRQVPPAYQIARLTPEEQDAIRIADRNAGDWLSYLSGGSSGLNTAQLIADNAARRAESGASMILGAGTPNDLAISAARNAMGDQDYYQQQARSLINAGAGAAGDAVFNNRTYQQQAQQGLMGATSAANLAEQRARLGIGAGAALGTGAAESAMGTLGSGQARLGNLVGGINPQLQAAAQGIQPQVGRGQMGAAEAASRARQSTAAAQQQLQQAAQQGTSYAQQAMSQLGGTTGGFDPSGIGAFMNMYDDAAVQQALSDIARQGDIAQQNVAAQAAQAGAFGGSRQAVAEQELQRNVLEQQGRTAAQMRQAGYESAAQRAQQAYEAQQARGQSAAQIMGGLGQQGVSSALQAAQAGGQLGLSAEQLAQTGSLQGAQLGLSGQQGIGSLLSQMGQLGLSSEQQRAALAQAQGQLGLQAGQQEIGAQQAIGQMGMTAAQQAAANAQAMGQLGVNYGQLGLQGAQQQTAAGQAMGQLGTQYGALTQQEIQTLGQLAQQRGQLGQALAGAGTAIGNIAAQTGTLGLQEASLGELYGKLTSQDIQNLLTVGATERGVAQAELDALRLSNYEAQMAPYQRLGFQSDVYFGVPSGQSTITATSAPQVSPFQSAIGLGIQGLSAAAGARNAGLF